MEYMMGVDIGTTNWKVATYSLDGKCVTSRSVPARIEYNEYGQMIYNPDKIWRSVCTGIRNCLAQGRLL